MTLSKIIRPVVAVAVLMLTASAAAAQSYPIDRGSMVLGGTASFTSSGGEAFENSSGDRSNVLLINPFGMYFVVPGLALGGQVLLRSYSGSSSTTLGVGPSAAYYFGGPESRVYPYLSAAVAYEWVTSVDPDRNRLLVGGAAGVALMLSQAVAVLVEAGYDVETFSFGESSMNANHFRLEAGIGAFIF